MEPKDVQLRQEVGAVSKVPEKTLSDAGLDANISRKQETQN
jgi:hypothetical protein